jgi:hypothetical protein
MHREDYDQSLTRNAIWVDAYSVVGGKTELSTAFADKNKNLSGQYVLLEGSV